jgi:hypothetical protein
MPVVFPLDVLFFVLCRFFVAVKATNAIPWCRVSPNESNTIYVLDFGPAYWRLLPLSQAQKYGENFENWAAEL